MNDPTAGDLELHFSGVGSVTLAQKHTEAIGIISDLEQVPVQNGLQTGTENIKFWGFFSAFHLMKVWTVCLKQAGGFSTTQFSCGSCSTA